MSDPIRRYRFARGQHPNEWIVGRDPKGDWVPFDEHQALTVSLQIAVEKAQAALAIIRDHGERASSLLARHALEQIGELECRS